MFLNPDGLVSAQLSMPVEVLIELILELDEALGSVAPMTSLMAVYFVAGARTG